MEGNDRLKQQVERQAKRMRQAEDDQSTLLSQTIYIGTLGLIFVLPVIGGVYLGYWLDSQMEGYSIHWTMTLLFLGLVIGVLNVYLFVREH